MLLNFLFRNHAGYAILLSILLRFSNSSKDPFCQLVQDEDNSDQNKGTCQRFFYDIEYQLPLLTKDKADEEKRGHP